MRTARMAANDMDLICEEVQAFMAEHTPEKDTLPTLSCFVTHGHSKLGQQVYRNGYENVLARLHLKPPKFYRRKRMTRLVSFECYDGVTDSARAAPRPGPVQPSSFERPSPMRQTPVLPRPQAQPGMRTAAPQTVSSWGGAQGLRLQAALVPRRGLRHSEPLSRRRLPVMW